MSIVSRVI
jgi:receptor expression-enhancing protein 5/6